MSRLQGRAPEGATGTRIVSDVAGVAADVLLTRPSVALLVRDRARSAGNAATTCLGVAPFRRGRSSEVFPFRLRSPRTGT
jgi:hypothetical protein